MVTGDRHHLIILICFVSNHAMYPKAVFDIFPMSHRWVLWDVYFFSYHWKHIFADLTQKSSSKSLFWPTGSDFKLAFHYAKGIWYGNFVAIFVAIFLICNVLSVEITLELESFCKFDLPRGSVIFTLYGLLCSGKSHGPQGLMFCCQIFFNLGIMGFLGTPGLVRV